MNEIAQFAPEWLVGIVVVAFALKYVGQLLSEASETWSRLLGPLGRRWRANGLRRQQERVEAREIRQADFADVTRQLEYISTQLEQCRAATESRDEFIAYDARWHRDLNLQAIEAGCDLPAYMTYRQWLAQSN
ncbi:MULTISPECIES: hypothetical protein [Nocardia]|uniref:hypothetical protein n=1 Tax=Nocardia TaxID=1817 RepID=UPI000D69ADF2|nr:MULTISPECIES: hypothetical protein [Nocardia]